MRDGKNEIIERRAVLLLLGGGLVSGGVGCQRRGGLVAPPPAPAPAEPAGAAAVIIQHEGSGNGDLGAPDGKRITFQLALAVPAALVFFNGSLLREGDDYTRQGAALAFASPPGSADRITALLFP